MSGNYFPTGQTPYPVNLPFAFTSNLPSNHAAPGEVPWNMNLSCINNQAAGHWPNYYFQPYQPPRPQFPPPQQPPSLPQENWFNGYTYHQQINFPRTDCRTENMMPNYFPQYPSQPSVPYVLPTSFPSFTSISQVMQREFRVGTHNARTRNVYANKGPIAHSPKVFRHFVSTSIPASREENNSKECLINNKREENSVVEANAIVACKSSTSVVNTAPVKAVCFNSDGGEFVENELVSKDCPNPKPSGKEAVNAGNKGRLVCAYCKEGHRSKKCPKKPCYKCDNVGHKAKKCPESLINANFDWKKLLTPQSPISKCVTGANAATATLRRSDRLKSFNEQLTPSSLNSTAPIIVNNDNIEILPNEFPRRSRKEKATQEESIQEADDSPSRKKIRKSCDNLPAEKNVNFHDKSTPLSKSFKNLPREELERIIMAHDDTVADLKRQLDYSKERVAILELEVISLKIKNDGRRSDGVLAEGDIPDRQNNYQTSSIKIEKIEFSMSKNMFSNSTNEDCSKEIHHSPLTSINIAPISKPPTTNCGTSKSELVIKKEKL